MTFSWEQMDELKQTSQNNLLQMVAPSIGQILTVIDPQTTNERVILKDSIVRAGLIWGRPCSEPEQGEGEIDHISESVWGKPRPGHEEGEIYKHVNRVWENINRLSHKVFVIDTFPGGSGPSHAASVVRGSESWIKLRTIALVHDTFKFQVDITQPESHENHHGMRARRYAEHNFPNIFDSQMLDVLELHDEAHDAWLSGSRNNNWVKAEYRAHKLRERLMYHDSVPMFTKFYMCDTHSDERPDQIWWKKFLKESGDYIDYFLA